MVNQRLDIKKYIYIYILAKGGGPKKRFQYCLNPNSSKHFLYFTAIQGHSGGNTIDPELQDTVKLLPEGFIEYIYHIGNISEMHSMIRSGLIPGGISFKKGRQSVFFTFVNPMDDDHGMEETPCDLNNPRITLHTKILGNLIPITENWCNLKLAQKRGLQFYQTRLHAIVLCNTLPAVCIEKAVCMKTKEELYHKVYLNSSLHVLYSEANSHSGQQDQRDQDARISCGIADLRGNLVQQRVPLAAVEQQDRNRNDKVKRLIQQFEIHPNKESFLQDLNQTVKINKFNEKSQKLIADMNSTEIFGLCETSSKKQCSDCFFFREIGIVFCSCGIFSKPSQRTKEFDKNNYNILSISGYGTATSALQGCGNVAKSSSTQAWRKSIHTSTMAQRRTIPKVFVRN